MIYPMCMVEHGFLEPIHLELSDKNKATVKFAIIFDRDGLVNRNAPPHEHIIEVKSFEILEEFYELYVSLEPVKDKCAIVVFTNQRWIQDNKKARDKFEEIMNFMNEKLTERCGFGVDLVMCCPHEHEDPNCNCRKPKPGMLLWAMEYFNLEASDCLVIGDTDFDIQAANNADIEHKIKTRKDMPLDASPGLKAFIASYGN